MAETLKGIGWLVFTPADEATRLIAALNSESEQV